MEQGLGNAKDKRRKLCYTVRLWIPKSCKQRILLPGHSWSVTLPKIRNKACFGKLGWSEQYFVLPCILLGKPGCHKLGSIISVHRRSCFVSRLPLNEMFPQPPVLTERNKQGSAVLKYQELVGTDDQPFYTFKQCQSKESLPIPLQESVIWICLLARGNGGTGTLAEMH